MADDLLIHFASTSNSFYDLNGSFPICSHFCSDKHRKRIKQKGRHVLITTRESNGYTEVVELLKLYKVKFFNIGSFGGSELRSKLAASLERQIALSEFIKNFDIKVLVSLCSVDANRVAFGLGISIINFYDIPLSDHKTNFKRALPQARLTLPLSKCVFHPFVVPKEVFLRMA